MITSLKNKNIKRIRALSTNRRQRTREKAFFIEGVHAINAARNNGWTIEQLVYNPEAQRSEWAQAIINETPDSHLLPVNDYVQAQLSDRESASELMAVVAQRPDELSRIPVDEDLLVLLLDRPHSPGNLGSAIRSADALGASGLIVTGHAADLYDPKTVRASMGSMFSLPVVRVQEHSLLENWLGEVRAALGNLTVTATSAHGQAVVYDYDLIGPSVLIIGNETVGISQYFEELCDVLLSIPMYGTASSFNASVAASLFLYEVRRQRAMNISKE